MAQRRANGLDKRPIGGRTQLPGHKRRQVPVLSLGVEGVGRGPHGAILGQQVLPDPGVRAAGMEADGQVLHDAAAPPPPGPTARPPAIAATDDSGPRRRVPRRSRRRPGCRTGDIRPASGASRRRTARPRHSRRRTVPAPRPCCAAILVEGRIGAAAGPDCLQGLLLQAEDRVAVDVSIGLQRPGPRPPTRPAAAQPLGARHFFHAEIDAD